MSEIRIEEAGARGRYVLNAEDREAELTFLLVEGKMVVNHVGVPKPLEGKGYGTMLVEHAVNDARAKGLKIVPVCPFAALKIKRHPEWHDILDEGAA